MPRNKLEYSGIKRDLQRVLDDIAATGDSSKYDWQVLKYYIIVRVKDALFFMKYKYNDYVDKIGETFEDVVGELVELFYLFESE